MKSIYQRFVSINSILISHFFVLLFLFFSPKIFLQFKWENLSMGKRPNNDLFTVGMYNKYWRIGIVSISHPPHCSMQKRMNIRAFGFIRIVVTNVTEQFTYTQIIINVENNIVMGARIRYIYI